MLQQTKRSSLPAEVDLETPDGFRTPPSVDTGCGIMMFVTASKTLEKMRKHPLGWRIQDLPAVAEGNSVEWRRPGRGGSHVIFSAAGVREIVSVPSKRPIKPVYIKQFIALIDAAREASQQK